jgi:hypothetical protein
MAKKPGWRGVAAIGALGVVWLALPQFLPAAVPLSWEGRVVLESEVPRFFPAPDNDLTAKTTATIEVKNDLAGLSGTGFEPYEATGHAGDCTATSKGGRDITIRGGATGPPMPTLSGRYVRLSITKMSGEVVHTVVCPGQPAPVVRQPMPALPTVDVDLPFMDGAKKEYSYRFANGVVTSTVTLKLPCAWNALKPGGPAIEFRVAGAPVTGFDFSRLFDGAFDASLTKQELTAKAASTRPDDTTFVRGPHSTLGLTVTPMDFSNNVEIASRAASFGGGVCVWVDKVSFSLDKGSQFIAKEPAASGKLDCIAAIKAHERDHAMEQIAFFARYARALDAALQKLPGPDDALLNMDDSADIAETRMRGDVTKAIYDVMHQYVDPRRTAPSRLDSEAESARVTALCNR